MTVTEESYSCTCSLRGARWLIFFSYWILTCTFKFPAPFAEGSVGEWGGDAAIWICLCFSDRHGMDPSALPAGDHRSPVKDLSAEGLCDAHGGPFALGLQRWDLVPHPHFQTWDLTLFWLVLWGKWIFSFQSLFVQLRGPSQISSSRWVSSRRRPKWPGILDVL